MTPWYYDEEKKVWIHDDTPLFRVTLMTMGIGITIIIIVSILEALRYLGVMT